MALNRVIVYDTGSPLEITAQFIYKTCKQTLFSAIFFYKTLSVYT